MLSEQNVFMFKEEGEAPKTPEKKELTLPESINLINNKVKEVLSTPGIQFPNNPTPEEIQKIHDTISSTYPTLNIVKDNNYDMLNYLNLLIKNPEVQNNLLAQVFENSKEKFVSYLVDLMNVKLPKDLQLSKELQSTNVSSVKDLASLTTENFAFVYSLAPNPLLGINQSLEYWLKIEEDIIKLKEIKNNPELLKDFISKTYEANSQLPGSKNLVNTLKGASLANDETLLNKIKDALIYVWVPSSAEAYGSADNASFMFSKSQLVSYLGAKSLLDTSKFPNLIDVLNTDKILLSGNNLEEGLKTGTYPIKFAISMTKLGENNIYPDQNSLFYLTANEPLIDPGRNASVDIELLKNAVQGMIDDGVIYKDIKKAQDEAKQKWEQEGNAIDKTTSGDQQTAQKRASKLKAEEARQKKLTPIEDMLDDDSSRGKVLQMAIRLTVTIKMMVTGEYKSLDLVNNTSAFDNILLNGIGKEIMNMAYGLEDFRAAIEGFKDMFRLLKGLKGGKAEDQAVGAGELDPAKINKAVEGMIKAEAEQLEKMAGLDLKKIFKNKHFLQIVSLIDKDTAQEVYKTAKEADEEYENFMKNQEAYMQKELEREEKAKQKEKGIEDKQAKQSDESKKKEKEMGLAESKVRYFKEDTDNFNTIKKNLSIYSQPSVSLAEFLHQNKAFVSKKLEGIEKLLPKELLNILSFLKNLINDKFKINDPRELSKTIDNKKKKLEEYLNNKIITQDEHTKLVEILEAERLESDKIARFFSNELPILFESLVSARNVSYYLSLLDQDFEEEDIDEEDVMDQIIEDIQKKKQILKDIDKKKINTIDDLINILEGELKAIIQTALESFRELNDFYKKYESKTLNSKDMKRVQDRNAKVDKMSLSWGSASFQDLKKQRLQSMMPVQKVVAKLGENNTMKKTSKLLETAIKLHENKEISSRQLNQVYLAETTGTKISTNLLSYLQNHTPINPLGRNNVINHNVVVWDTNEQIPNSTLRTNQRFDDLKDDVKAFRKKNGSLPIDRNNTLAFFNSDVRMNQIDSSYAGDSRGVDRILNALERLRKYD